jgi:hypothetical protein
MNQASPLPALLREWGRYRSAYSSASPGANAIYQIVTNCGIHFPHRHPHVFRHELETAQSDCYWQAWRRFNRTPGLKYCEGWLAARGNDFPIVHGWCAAPNGLVFDNTIRSGVEAEYYGVVFKDDFAREQWAKLNAEGAIGILGHLQFLGLTLSGLLAGLQLPPPAMPENPVSAARNAAIRKS